MLYHLLKDQVVKLPKVTMQKEKTYTKTYQPLKIILLLFLMLSSLSLFANSFLNELKEKFLSLPKEELVKRHQLIQTAIEEILSCPKEERTKLINELNWPLEINTHLHLEILKELSFSKKREKAETILKLESALKEFETLKDTSGAAYMLFLLGKNTPEKEMQTVYYKNAYEYAYTLQDTILQIKLLYLLADNYTPQLLDTIIIKYKYSFLKRGINLAERVQNEPMIYYYYKKMGYHFGALDQHDSTYYYFNKAFLLAQSLKDPDKIINSLVALGDYFHSDQGNSVKALEIMKTGFGILPNVKNSTLLPFYQRLAVFSEATNNIQQSIHAIDSLMKYAQLDAQKEWWLYLSYRIKSRVLSKQKKYKSSVESLEKALKLYQLYQTKNHSSKINEIEAKYQNDQKQKLIKIQEITLTKKTEAIRKGQLILNGLLAFFLIASIFSYFFYQQYREKQKAIKLLQKSTLQIKKQNKKLQSSQEKIQKLLSQKERELMTSTILISQQNKFILNISNKIGDLQQSKSNTKVHQTIQEIRNSIQINTNNQNQWEAFKIQFENLHPNFFKALKIVCPILTENDLRHCAYLHLGLTNKEVANILNVSFKSISVFRSRIKKKLGIDSKIKLKTYISDITTNDILI